jgi:hypothetical protein
MYVDSDYYKNTYKGILIPDNEISNRLETASDSIDDLTYNRITAIGFENLTTFQQDKIKKAVCIQADFLYQYGDYMNLPVDGYTAGSITLSLGKGNSGIKAPGAVSNYLRQSGLSCRIL